MEGTVIVLYCIQTGWSCLFVIIHRKVHESTSVLQVLSLSPWEFFFIIIKTTQMSSATCIISSEKSILYRATLKMIGKM
jgi:hypothetical protein